MSHPSQQFCVRWNSYHTNLQTVFPKLLTTENFVDVTLACENRQIKCHKVVLSACSTYFERLLIQNPCKHPIIFMKDMRFSEMQSLVDFMYKGEVNVSQDDLPSLLKSAEALQIRGLCGTDSNQDSPPSVPAPPHQSSCNASVNTSPRPQDNSSNNINSKKYQQPQSPNAFSNQSMSPSSNGVHHGEKRKREDSPETCNLKQETVEEDGLYYGDMESGQQEDEELLQTGNLSAHQVSGNKKQAVLRVKPSNVLLKEDAPTEDKLHSKENKKSILADKLSQKLNRKQEVNYDLFKNHFLSGFLQTKHSDTSEFVDEKIFENEDYLKLYLEHNQELEVSTSHGAFDSDLKSKKTYKKIFNKEKASAKSWANPFATNFSNIDQKQLSNDLKLKNKKKSEKISNAKKMSKVENDGVDLLDFVEPGDLDQFLAGKEVSSSGLSRSAVEQAMLGKYNPNRRYSNEAMWAALMDVKKGGSIYRAAQTHKVPRKSLRNWMKRWHIKSSFPMPQQLKQFVENNRRTKMELRKELTNSLLCSLGLDKEKSNVINEENRSDNYRVVITEENTLDQNMECEPTDGILNLKMDLDKSCNESQDEAVDLRQEKNDNSNEDDDVLSFRKDKEAFGQIVDMSGKVLYDESVNDAVKFGYNIVGSTYPQINSKPKSIDKKIVSFSNVEQLAGIQSEN